MRMMTGAILILASVVLLAVHGYINSIEADGVLKLPNWQKYYAYAIGIIGWLFMVWGLLKDLRSTRYQSKGRRKGDT
ncbi:MAG: hypothetical protein JXA11_13675 [Phycisphaerae bacterium]|nr:hypothetical protein [Phycisphaerae bacterium]